MRRNDSAQRAICSPACSNARNGWKRLWGSWKNFTAERVCDLTFVAAIRTRHRDVREGRREMPAYGIYFLGEPADPRSRSMSAYNACPSKTSRVVMLYP